MIKIIHTSPKTAKRPLMAFIFMSLLLQTTLNVWANPSMDMAKAGSKIYKNKTSVTPETTKGCSKDSAEFQGECYYNPIGDTITVSQPE